MGNRKFKEKQYGKKSDDGKQNQECYVNSALKITSSLGNQDVQKWNSDIIKRRGEALFLLWAKNGPRIISKEIGRKDKQKTAILEPMANSLENVTIYGLLNSDESSTLEFKRAYFDDRGGDVKLGKVTKLIARTNATINAFANTNGGDLILGKQDTSSDADDVLGINKTINYFENKAVEAGKNKSHGRELFINGLSKSIRSFYKSKRYPIKFVTKLVLLRNEKWVAHINVEKYEDDNGPVPYFHPSKDTSSDVNSGVFFIRHAAESVPYPHNKPKPTENKRNPAKEQIFIINEDYKDNSKDSVLGPFKSASTADNYIKRLYNQSCIDETNIPSRSRRKNISFANRADLEIICDGMFKTPGLKYEDSNGRRACWIVNLVNLPKKWDMDYEIKRPGYTPGSIAHLLK